MKTIITLFISICTATFARSQTDSFGELQGRVYDRSTNEGIPFAPVVLEKDGVQKGVGQTDDNGNYTIKPISPGSYDLRVQYLGYGPVLLQGINISAHRISFQNVAMQSSVQYVNVAARNNTDVYIIDGIKVCGSMLPVENVDVISIITGGLPAKYESANEAIDASELKTPGKNSTQDLLSLHSRRFQF